MKLLPVLVNSAPLFGDALSACQGAFREVEILKHQLRQFEMEDLPSYHRWYGRSFKPHLAAIRDAAALLQSYEAELHIARQRHWDRFFGGASPITAGTTHYSGDYFETSDEDEVDSRGFRQSASSYRTFGNPEEDTGEDLEEERDGSSFYNTEDEDEIDPEIAQEYEERLRRGSARQNWSFYRARGEAGRERARTDYRGRRDSDPNETTHREGAPNDDSLVKRVKDRYRLLARRLHPDLNPHLSLELRALWNRAQAAYQARNLDELDVLVALSATLSGDLPSETSLHELRTVAKEIERMIAPLNRRLREARNSRAWNFSRLADHDELREQIERELHRELLALKHRTDELVALIRRFTRASNKTERTGNDSTETLSPA